MCVWSCRSRTAREFDASEAARLARECREADAVLADFRRDVGTLSAAFAREEGVERRQRC